MDWLQKVLLQLVEIVFSPFFDALNTLMAYMVFDGIDLFQRSVTDLFDTNLDWFNSTFPIVGSLQQVIMVMAFSFAILSMVWQLFRSMGGQLSGDVEEPWIIVARTGVFLFLIAFSQDLCNMFLDFATIFYKDMTNVNDATGGLTTLERIRDMIVNKELLPDQYSVDYISGLEDGLSNQKAYIFYDLFRAVGVWFFESLLAFILIIPIMWNYIKLVLEAAERYVVMCVMYYSAPLALSMGASKSTNNITRSWARMYGSSLLMLILNVWCLKMFASAVACSLDIIVASQFNFFALALILFAFLKVAQHLDEYLSAMGLSVAKTGGSLIDDVMGTYGAISSIVNYGKSAKSLVGGGKGSTDSSGSGLVGTPFGSANPTLPMAPGGSGSSAFGNVVSTATSSAAYLSSGQNENPGGNRTLGIGGTASAAMAGFGYQGRLNMGGLGSSGGSSGSTVPLGINGSNGKSFSTASIPITPAKVASTASLNGLSVRTSTGTLERFNASSGIFAKDSSGNSHLLDSVAPTSINGQSVASGSLTAATDSGNHIDVTNSAFSSDGHAFGADTTLYDSSGNEIMVGSGDDVHQLTVGELQDAMSGELDATIDAQNNDFNMDISAHDPDYESDSVFNPELDLNSNDGYGSDFDLLGASAGESSESEDYSDLDFLDEDDFIPDGSNDESDIDNLFDNADNVDSDVSEINDPWGDSEFPT